MSRQLSFLKTHFFSAFQKLIPIFLCHLFEQGSDMSMKLPSVHLSRHFLAFLLFVIFFRAFVSPVSSLSASETLSFFQELVSLFDRQSIDIHVIQITFSSWEVIFLLWDFVFSSSSSCLFYGSIDLGMFMIQFGRPVIPVGNDLEWCFQFHQLECQAPGQRLLEQFNGQGVCGINF
jgi:hypothetical protein